MSRRCCAFTGSLFDEDGVWLAESSRFGVTPPVPATVPPEREPHWAEWERNGRRHPIFGALTDYPPYDRMLVEARDWAAKGNPNGNSSFRYHLERAKGKGRRAKIEAILATMLAENDGERPNYEACLREDREYREFELYGSPYWLHNLSSISLIRNHYLYRASVILPCEAELANVPEMVVREAPRAKPRKEARRAA